MSFCFQAYANLSGPLDNGKYVINKGIDGNDWKSIEEAKRRKRKQFEDHRPQKKETSTVVWDYFHDFQIPIGY